MRSLSTHSSALLVCLLAVVGTPAADLAHVIDADTLEIEGRTVRLTGLIAPGPEQGCRAGDAVWHCGRVAAEALRAQIASGAIDCIPSEEDPARAVCFSQSVELNRWLVRAGWAIADGPRYQREQERAIAAGAGIWRGGFSPNSAWIDWAKEGPKSVGSDSCDVCAARKRQWTRP